MTIQHAAKLGAERVRSFMGPAIGALAASALASVGGLLEGQAFYKLVLDSGGLAVLAFVLFFLVRRFTQSTSTQTELLRDELRQNREAHTAEMHLLHKRFDENIERHERRERELRQDVARPVNDLVQSTRELVNELRLQRTAARQITPPENAP